MYRIFWLWHRNRPLLHRYRGYLHFPIICYNITTFIICIICLMGRLEIIMYHFYIDQGNIYDRNIHITGTDVNHIKNVLRLEKGDWVIACDGMGVDYISRIEDMDSACIKLEICKIQESGTELGTRLVLFQGIPKGDKMEFIVQKSVELGVSLIVPVFMKR